LGIDKSLATLQHHFSWPGMRSQVAAYVTSCDRCQRDKASNQKSIGLLQPLEVPSEPWEHVSLDFIMSLPPSGGFDAILVVVDKLSKSMVLIPTQTTVSAKETARLYFNHVYCRHGLARKVISDRDVRFTGKFWQELHKLLQVKLAMSSSFHPQTDGQTERANRTLEEMVRHYVAHHQRTGPLSSPHWSSPITPVGIEPPECPRSMFVRVEIPSSSRRYCCLSTPGPRPSVSMLVTY
jgi:Integrase zinc binding domain